jgi:hypothetical protein
MHGARIEPQAWSTRRLATTSGHRMLPLSRTGLTPTRKGAATDVFTTACRRGSSTAMVDEKPLPNWNV